MFCTEKERKTCNVEKMGCEGCFYNNDINKLKEMFNKRPDELEGETLKLFETIMKIADERDKLREENKEFKKENEKLNKANKVYINSIQSITPVLLQDYIEKSKVKEKIEELKPRIEQYDEYNKQRVETDVEFYENIADTAIVQVLQELLEEEE